MAEKEKRYGIAYESDLCVSVSRHERVQVSFTNSYK